MARALRVEYPGACYHIINRGNRREEIFKRGSDCELFLDKLSEYSELYGVVIHSYCIMPNHFHIQLQTLNGNLGKFMQSFLTSFTLSMNKKYNKSGHLFQGRYKSQVIETEKYRNKLSRYIHLNPIKVKALDEASPEYLLEKLRKYKWSSYRIYLGLEEKPDWLDCSHVLSYWSENEEERITRYSEYVESGIETDNTEELAPSELSSIIGSEKFTEYISQKYLMRNRTMIDQREQPVLMKVNTPEVKSVVSIIANHFEIEDLNKIYVRKGSHKQARKVAMYLASKHCRSNISLTSIADMFGVKLSGLNIARDRLKENLESDKKLGKEIKIIENRIEKYSFKRNNV